MKHALNQIYFYLTEGCNLRCRHCWIAPKHETEEHKYKTLDFELFKSIVKQAKPLGMSGVKLTGGEPLLHPRIKDILEFIKSEGLRLVIETNGVLCTPELAKAISGVCKKPFASVSLDGSDAETHEWVRGVKGCFEAAKEGARNLAAAGLKPQIIMSIMRQNKSQMESVVRMAESLGAGSVKFNLIQPTARGEKMHDAGETLTIDELVEIGQWVENELSSSTNLRLIYHHPAAFKPLGKIFGSNGNGCGQCGVKGILGVLANGLYALCGIGESVPELIFGQAETDRLEDVWNNTRILNDIRDGLPERLEGVCGDCVMKGRCLGSCIAQNYYTGKSLWSPFWYCEQAKSRGLFPESRLRPEALEMVK